VIKNFEPGTSSFEERIEAARKVANADYPLGFIVAPIYMHEDWKEGYLELFQRLSDSLQGINLNNLSFELIQHRFTKPAKNVIQKRYPKSKLEMDETKRKYKWGRYGIGKYVYQTEEAEDLETTLRRYIHEFFPQAEIQYFT
jgi:spore photoproduct lyase